MHVCTVQVACLIMNVHMQTREQKAAERPLWPAITEAPTSICNVTASDSLLKG